jgi:MFS family permease
MAPETRGAAVAAFAFSIFFGQTVGAAVMGAIVGTTGYRLPIAVAAGGIALLAAWFRARLPELERARTAAVSAES